MKLRFLAAAVLSLSLCGCAYDPYGPDVSGNVAFNSSGVYAGSVGVGVGTGGYYSPGYFGTSLLFPVLPPPVIVRPVHRPPPPAILPPPHRLPPPGSGLRRTGRRLPENRRSSCPEDRADPSRP